VEHACGLATLQMGEFVSNVSTGIDTYSIREPLGVCAGICPFDFPAMIPLWVSLVYAFNFTVYLSLVLGYSFSLVS
jgi:acyl-CoA reductase-like NAD-dependent aldehyde dehydrogenase